MLERMFGRALSLQIDNHTLDIQPHTGKLSLGYYDARKKWMPVYYRSLSEYVTTTSMPRDICESIAQNGQQLIDVGAGLAELAPKVAVLKGRKPIVIEPLNYDYIQKLLSKARRKNLSEENIVLVDQLLERVAVYLDPSLIHLIPLTVQDAQVRYFNELQGVGDVVVDVAGAIKYSGSIETHRVVHDLEKDWLVKKSPQGVLYTEHAWLT